MIVIIGGIKGGTGKSTIATNLAAHLSCNTVDVILVDANPGQTTSSNWVSRRNEFLPVIHCVEKSGDLRQTLRDFSKRYEQVIVDCGGWDSREFRTALLVSQLLITPLRPSQADLETLPKLAEVVDQAADINEKLEVTILITQAPPHPSIKLVEEAREALKELQGFVVSTNVIYNRKPYIDCLADGIGVIETKGAGGQKAKMEIESLAKEVYS